MPRNEHELCMQNNSCKLLLKCLIKVFPRIDREIKSYLNILKNDETEILYDQAMEDFCQRKLYFRDGSMYALYPDVELTGIVKIIVSLNFMCYYLDWICNLTSTKNESNLRQMYMALLDSFEPERKKLNYFKYSSGRQKSQLLDILVDLCRNRLKTLPSYEMVRELIIKYVRYYIDLQVYKHMDKETRSDMLETWTGYYLKNHPDIYWWEFASASESLFGVFALIAATNNPKLTSLEVDTIDSVYFPWICSLHSLLNHYVNCQDHFQMGDINFTSYYKNLKQCEERISFFIDKSLLYCTKLKHSDFHASIVKTLIAAYLSDPKAFFGMNKLCSSNLLIQPPPTTDSCYKIYRFLRLITQQ